MANSYKEKYVTVFYIDIRNYTKLSKLKEPTIIVDFILEFRKTISRNFSNIKRAMKHLITINIGDAVLIIIETDISQRRDDLKLVINISKNVRKDLLSLLLKWGNKKDQNNNTMNYFEKVNFGIGISQGTILMQDNDYVGFPINHAAKIGDMRTLHKQGHIGIDKDIFDSLDIGSQIFLDKETKGKFIGHTKVGDYIYYMPYERQYGEIS